MPRAFLSTFYGWGNCARKHCHLLKITQLVGGKAGTLIQVFVQSLLWPLCYIPPSGEVKFLDDKWPCQASERVDQPQDLVFILLNSVWQSKESEPWTFFLLWHMYLLECLQKKYSFREKRMFRINSVGTPGWLSSWASAFALGCDPGIPRSSPASGSLPASPSACVSASFSLCLSWINKY